MPSSLLTLAGWSYGIAAVAYIALGMHLLLGRETGLRARILLWTSVCATASAVFTLLYVHTSRGSMLDAGSFAQVLAYAGWYAFLLSLLRPAKHERAPNAAYFYVFAALASAIIIWGL